MTDSNWNDELTEDEISQLDALLGKPELWDEPDSADEDAIVAAIRAETAHQVTAETAHQVTAETAHQVTAETAGGPVTADSLSDTTPERTSETVSMAATEAPLENVVSISRARRWFTPVLSVAAGALLALIGVAAVANLNNGDVDGTVELALAGTDLAPAAEATAKIVDLPSGTRILLDVSMLEPAPPGSYYEAWLRKDAEVGVSAGTFHLRGGDGEIELWAGVSTTEYPLVTVTIQDEAEPTSSGRVVLKGLLASE